MEHDPLAIGDCECDKCRPLDEPDRALIEEAKQILADADNRYFEFLDTTIQRQIAIAKQLGLFEAAKWMESRVKQFCQVCGVDIIRNRRAPRIKLCPEHKTTYQQWKDRERARD